MSRSIIFGLLVTLIVCQASSFNLNRNDPNPADPLEMIRMIVNDIDKEIRQLQPNIGVNNDLTSTTSSEYSSNTKPTGYT
jgi:hypothetical protein